MTKKKSKTQKAVDVPAEASGRSLAGSNSNTKVQTKSKKKSKHSQDAKPVSSGKADLKNVTLPGTSRTISDAVFTSSASKVRTKEKTGSTAAKKVLKTSTPESSKQKSISKDSNDAPGPSKSEKKGKTVLLSQTLHNHPTPAPAGPINTAGPHSAATITKSSAISPSNTTFSLAAATSVPLSTRLTSQFYESQLLLFVLERIRGDHSRREVYHGELDRTKTELRRSFIDKLAYVCDFEKGGSSVTAIALQQTYQGVTFWIAANETVKPKVLEFLTKVLDILKPRAPNQELLSRKSIESILLTEVVQFNRPRLESYWAAMKAGLAQGLELLEGMIASQVGKVGFRGLRNLASLLSSLPGLSTDHLELVRKCYEARNNRCTFETLTQLAVQSPASRGLFENMHHLLGRLGEHPKAVKALVDASICFPALFDDYLIKVQPSPRSYCTFQTSKNCSLEQIAHDIFPKIEDIAHYQAALMKLDQASNQSLLSHIKQERHFKTRVHAELLLIDLFYWNQFDFFEADRYVGCSKPACFSCYQYILAHPGNFVHPACHNKIYLMWRAPDILERDADLEERIRIRESITNKMCSKLRLELRTQIDGRFPKRGRQFDSVTGTSSSIRAASFQGVLSRSGSCDHSTSGVSEHSIFSADYDDSDDDLSWYNSRVQDLRLVRTR